MDNDGNRSGTTATAPARPKSQRPAHATQTPKPSQPRPQRPAQQAVPATQPVVIVAPVAPNPPVVKAKPKSQSWLDKAVWPVASATFGVGGVLVGYVAANLHLFVR